jgi:hypothetical protein
MTTLIVSALLVLCLLVFTVLKSISKKRIAQAGFQTGFKLMLDLQRLIELIQQHRGMTYALSNGNEQMKIKLQGLDKQVDTIINGQHKVEFAKFEQWKSFVEHWPRLKANSLSGSLTAENLMRQHNMVIEGHLSLLDEITHYYDLHTLMLDRFVRVSELCIDTLRTAETIAQARGLGSGICSKGERHGADSIQLNYLKVSLASTTKQLFAELEGIDNDDVKTKFAAFSISLKANIEKFVDVLDKELLTKKKLTIKTQEYFDLATKPIDDLVSLFIFMVDYSAKQNERGY